MQAHEEMLDGGSAPGVLGRELERTIDRVHTRSYCRGMTSTPRKLTLLERTKIQAEVLVPLVRAMESQLGSVTAHRLVREAIGGQVREQIRANATDRPADTVEWGHRISRAGDAQDIDHLDSADGEINIDVTRCEYASFFQQLGAPDLGFLLVCMLDYDIADGVDGLTLDREQTIMQGADHCDFRWKIDMRPASAST